MTLHYGATFTAATVHALTVTGQAVCRPSLSIRYVWNETQVNAPWSLPWNLPRCERCAKALAGPVAPRVPARRTTIDRAVTAAAAVPGDRPAGMMYRAPLGPVFAPVTVTADVPDALRVTNVDGSTYSDNAAPGITVAHDVVTFHRRHGRAVRLYRRARPVEHAVTAPDGRSAPGATVTARPLPTVRPLPFTPAARPARRPRVDAPPLWDRFAALAHADTILPRR